MMTVSTRQFACSFQTTSYTCLYYFYHLFALCAQLHVIYLLNNFFHAFQDPQNDCVRANRGVSHSEALIESGRKRSKMLSELELCRELLSKRCIKSTVIENLCIRCLKNCHRCHSSVGI